MRKNTTYAIACASLFFGLTLAIVSHVCSGCRSVTPPAASSPAGANTSAALNQWEANAFAVLLDSQAGILKATQQIQSGELPATLKGDLNRAIALQNTATQTLKTYDATVRSGGNGDSSQAEVVSEVGSILNLLVTLQQARPAKADAVIAPAK